MKFENRPKFAIGPSGFALIEGSSLFWTVLALIPVNAIGCVSALVLALAAAAALACFANTFVSSRLALSLMLTNVVPLI